MTNHQQQLGDAPLRKFEYDDGTVVFAADVGAGPEPSVDVVDRTAIVVAGDEQYEFEVPADDAEVFIRNGVLTVEVNEEAH
ncbi:DUF7127 family protein [Halomicrobium salinisoli]|uniref:DUF7127 family protein n=1 Tax=Halomicrobium salinisoli TaxID=2878391 RepID=UPI001CF057E7|nr:hypothetical protein [Halomicrobium salinisoli]